MTSDPSKKFRAELDLMYWGHDHFRFIRKYFQRRIFYIYNCDISHLSEIHSTVKFPHPCGVIIGSQAKIEMSCVIYQQVTIGSNFDGNNAMALVKKHTKIGAGAKLIGDIEVGEGCYIGANAVITKSIDNDCSVIGHNKHIVSKRKIDNRM